MTPIYDYDGTAMHEWQAVHDHDGTAEHELDKLMDFDGTTQGIIFEGNTDVVFVDMNDAATFDGWTVTTSYNNYSKADATNGIYAKSSSWTATYCNGHCRKQLEGIKASRAVITYSCNKNTTNTQYSHVSIGTASNNNLTGTTSLATINGQQMIERVGASAKTNATIEFDFGGLVDLSDYWFRVYTASASNNTGGGTKTAWIQVTSVIFYA